VAFAMTAAILAFVHYAAAFTVFGALMAELVLLKSELSLTSARSILRMDAAYGVAAGALLFAGFGRVVFTEKGVDYYFHSAPFIAKISLFALVGVLSIQPTRRFLGFRPELREGRVPALDEAARTRLRKTIHTELTLLAIIILCATLMARGIGYFG
jgi:putative membrane protein